MLELGIKVSHSRLGILSGSDTDTGWTLFLLQSGPNPLDVGKV